MGELKMTQEYSLFKTIEWNRKTSTGHVNKIASAIKEKNLLKDFPLIVDEEMYVLDGQHRLRAAKMLGVPIYYKKTFSMCKDDIALINSTSMKWNMESYLQMYITLGYEDYIKFDLFRSRAGIRNLTANRQLLNSCYGYSPTGIDGGGATNKFTSGEFKYPKEESKANDLVKQLHFFRDNGYSFWGTTRFVGAIIRINNVKEFDFGRLRIKFEYMSTKLKKCADYEDYIEILQDMYNHNVKNGEKLYLK